jgi:hypothetical protein
VVQCYNLSQEPGAFMSTAIVRRTLQAEGPACLPLGLLNGRVIFRRQYPKRRAGAGRERLSALTAGSVTQAENTIV